MEKTHRRRRYLIHRELQLPIVGIMLMLTLLTVLQMLVQLFVLDVDILAQAKQYGLQSDALTSSFIIVQRKELLLKLFAFLGVNLFLVGLFAVFYSHRVSGPIYRLERALDDLAQGKTVQPITFRRSDLFRGVAAHFNAAAARLQTQQQALQTVIDDLEKKENGAALTKLRGLLAEPPPAP